MEIDRQLAFEIFDEYVVATKNDDDIIMAIANSIRYQSEGEKIGEVGFDLVSLFEHTKKTLLKLVDEKLCVYVCENQEELHELHEKLDDKEDYISFAQILCAAVGSAVGSIDLCENQEILLYIAAYYFTKIASKDLIEYCVC